MLPVLKVRWAKSAPRAPQDKPAPKVLKAQQVLRAQLDKLALQVLRGIPGLPAQQVLQGLPGVPGVPAQLAQLAAPAPKAHKDPMVLLALRVKLALKETRGLSAQRVN